MFIGPPAAQAVTATFEWKELTAVTDLASASRAIELIVEQGEGARGDWVKSHFGRFVGILEDFLAMQAADPGFDPARPVEPAYVRLPPDVASGTLIEDRVTARVADLCNGLYEVMLQVLSRYYVHHGETPAELETLARTAKHLMNWVMRPLGSVLDHPADRSLAPRSDRRSGPRGRPARLLRAAPPRARLEDHRRTPQCPDRDLRRPRARAGSGRARRPCGKLRSMTGDIRTRLDERASPPFGSVYRPR